MMSNSSKSLADKYFENQCTSEEAEKVLQWFDTTEGELYLEDLIEKELETTEENSESEVYFSDGLDSKRLLSSILNRIRKFGFPKPGHHSRYRAILRIAAFILVLVSVSLLYQVNNSSESPSEEPIVTSFGTNNEEQKQIRLADGTSVRLNSNSKLTVSASYLNGSREVMLKGEAFFDVAHQAENPFIIQTDYAEVEVLGTSFNVKSVEGSHRAEVSVVDGKVEFYGNNDKSGPSITLGKDEYAYWDEIGKELKSEQFGAQNYLVWMTDQHVFEDLPLSQVCIQLARFYEVSCQFDSEGLQNLGLNATIPNPNLQNTLSVIALSLDLDFQQENERVVWKYSDSSE